MYIDLHGHSRKYNVFMYGCEDKKRPKPQVRAFPRFFSMHEIARKYFSFADCSFHVKKGREATARVVVSKELNIPLSFTLEATFCGPNYGPLKNSHMNIGHLQEVGAALCDAIFQFALSSDGRSSFCTMVAPTSLLLTTVYDAARFTNSVDSLTVVAADNPSNVDYDSGSDTGDESETNSKLTVVAEKGGNSLVKLNSMPKTILRNSADSMPIIESSTANNLSSVLRSKPDPYAQSSSRSLLSKAPTDLSRLYLSDGSASAESSRKHALLSDEVSAFKQGILSAPSSASHGMERLGCFERICTLLLSFF